jgi:hypothetical protein
MPRYEFFCNDLQEALLDSLVARRLRRRGGAQPTLRQPRHRAVLVGLQRHHLGEERLMIAPVTVAPILGQLTLPASPA